MSKVINYLEYLTTKFYDYPSNTFTIEDKHDYFTLRKLLEWQLNDSQFKASDSQKKAMVKRINQFKRMEDKND